MQSICHKWIVWVFKTAQYRPDVQDVFGPSILYEAYVNQMILRSSKVFCLSSALLECYGLRPLDTGGVFCTSSKLIFLHA